MKLEKNSTFLTPHSSFMNSFIYEVVYKLLNGLLFRNAENERN